ncbi:MAG: GWxTD domain-containing protein [Bacteroidia bacterium]|nr:GWxTD domain-containing protein [Bacteroidia bacterium]
MFRKIFIFVTVCLLSLSLKAQWELGVKNSLDKVFNTRLFLRYTATSDKQKNFLADIRFRPKGSYRTYLRKEVPLSTQQSTVFNIPVTLPPDDYEIDVDILDRDLNTHVSLMLDASFTVHQASEIQVSDIFLSYQDSIQQAFIEPVLGKKINPETENLYYYLEILAPGYEVLTVRAVLYKENEGQESPTTQAYQSLYQSNQILYLGESQHIIFKDILPIANLSAGEYLLDIRIYDDDEPLESEGIRFEVGGDIQKRIFSDLDESIRMMEYTVPLEILETLLRFPDEKVKAVEFREVWKELYGEKAEKMMEEYFRKIYEANERFSENIDGWQTSRGKIFIQYGEPKIKLVILNGKEYERWTYGKWSLSFLFEKRNQRYLLVE